MYKLLIVFGLLFSSLSQSATVNFSYDVGNGNILSTDVIGTADTLNANKFYITGFSNTRVNGSLVLSPVFIDSTENLFGAGGVNPYLTLDGSEFDFSAMFDPGYEHGFIFADGYSALGDGSELVVITDMFGGTVNDEWQPYSNSSWEAHYAVDEPSVMLLILFSIISFGFYSKRAK